MSSGLCFPYAMKYASKHGGEVVHAFVTNPATGKSFWHAWVEKGGVVHDDLDHNLPTEKFYAMMRPEQIRRYSDTEAMVYALRTGHHGPWEAGEAGEKPIAPKRVRAASAKYYATQNGSWWSMGAAAFRRFLEAGALSSHWVADRRARARCSTTSPRSISTRRTSQSCWRSLTRAEQSGRRRTLVGTEAGGSDRGAGSADAAPVARREGSVLVVGGG
jgi:hypothetical protein